MKMKHLLLAGILLCSAPSLLNGAPFSPWDAWRQGYTMFEKGQQQKDRGSYRRALQYFESALESYESVRKARPDWNQKIIQGRIDDCRKAIAAVKIQLDDAGADLFPKTSQTAQRPAVPSSSRLPEGIERQTYPQIFVGGDTAPSSGGASLSNAELEAQRAEVQKLRSENERYKNRLLQTMVELDDLRRQLARNKSSAEEVSNLLREQRVMQEKYTLLEKRYKTLETEAKKPDSRLNELRNQLLETRMNYELLQKRFELSENRLKAANETAAEIPLLKKAYEKLNAEKEKNIRQYEQKIAELKSLQESSLEERNQLRSQLDQLGLQLKNQREQLTARTRELNSFQKKFEEALKSGGNSEALNKRILEENRQLQEKITSLFSQLTAEQKKVIDGTSARQELMRELLTVRESMKQRDSRITELQSELQDTRKGAERDRTLTQQAANQIQTLRDHNQQLSADLKLWAEKAQKLEKRLNSQLNQSYKLQADLDNAAQQNKEQTASMTAQQNALNRRIQELLTVQKDMQKKIDAEHSLMLKEKAARLAFADKLKEEQTKTTDLSAKLDAAAKELRQFIELKVNFAALQKENSKNKEQVQQLTARNQDLNRTAEKAGQVDGLRKQIAELQKQNQSLSDKNRQLQLTVADQGEIAMIRERLDLLQKENNKLQTRELPALRQKAQEYALLKAKLENAEKHAKQLEAAAQKHAELQVKVKQLQTLEGQLAEQKKALAQQSDLHKQKLDALRVREELQKKEIARLQNELKKTLDAATARTRAELQQQERRQEEKQKKLELLAETQRKEIVKLQAEVKKHILGSNTRQDALNSLTEIHKKELSAAKQQISDMQKQLTSQQREMELRQQQSKKELLQQEQLRQKNHDLELANKSMQHQLRQLETRLKQQTAIALQKESAEKKMLELSEAMSKAAQQMSMLQQEKKRSKDDYELLQQQIQILRKENRELAAARITLPAIPGKGLKLDDLPDLQISDKDANIPPQQLIAAGKKAETEGKNELAIWNYRAVLEKDGNNIEAAGRLGNLYLKRQDYRRAEPLLALARSVDPDDTTFAVANAQALNGLGKYGNALALLEPLLRKSPLNPDLLLLTAKAFAGSGQNESAKALLQKGLETYTENPKFPLEFARILVSENKGAEKEAANYYQNYLSLGGTPDLELQPKLAKLLNEQQELQDFMGSAAAEAEKNNDWTSASWYYRQLLNGSSRNGKLAAKLAFAYFMSNQYPAAAEVLAMHQPTPHSGLIGALLQYVQGEYSGTIQKAREARKLNKNMPINLSAEWKSLKQELKKRLAAPASAQQKQAAEILQGVYL
ncbi:MAG: tetratricopeptide repeat protein [Lentisphaeria bacterium]|nr:tetratricopeptide repeat protein [Lentisphaeria bacterium]